MPGHCINHGPNGGHLQQAAAAAVAATQLQLQSALGEVNNNKNVMFIFQEKV